MRDNFQSHKKFSHISLIRNCDVIRARFCDLEGCFDQLNWIFWDQVSIFLFCLTFCLDQVRGVQPAAHDQKQFFCAVQTVFRVQRIIGILIIFPSVFDRLRLKLWKKCGPETNFGLDASGLDCERWNHRFWRRALSAVSWDWWKIIVSLAMGCPVGLAWFSWFQKISRKSMICCLRNNNPKKCFKIPRDALN